MPITRIVSGGQTGADRGGLDAAIYCQIPHGGWCPKGRRAEDGTIPLKYQLQEMPTSDYLSRTEANVVDSDATLVFTEKMATGGSLRTIEFALKHGRPWHHISMGLWGRDRATKQILKWLQGEIAFDYETYQIKPPKSCVLNVAGSRESGYKGISDAVMAVMVDVLRAVNLECQGVYPVGGVGKGLALN